MGNGVGAQEMQIGQMTIGVDSTGIETYSESLRLDLLENVKQKLKGEAYISFRNEIANCWQGESRDRFLDQLERAVDNICVDLETEYTDIWYRLEELKNQFLKQDKYMVGEED